ncbi:hypothetical protein [Pinibacter aurantiacus]|uniref:Uncharacterized protein n=1 Tax=Pinibacter aurantiacus TaxID=2851599 RepID=A0A9E2SCF8_9BACT|nr:hypothetical protein [Pinibacter aurantiacus]MBV4360041.1 hypothetical protein [Pinibacter aurantiacus]
MKFITAICCLTLLMFAGCKKNNDSASSAYHINFKVNGEQQNFNYQASFQYSVPQNVGVNFFRASLLDSALEATPDYIEFALNGANVAHINAADVPKFTTTLNFTYYDKDGKKYTTSNLPHNTDEFVKLDITEITDKTIKGTFSAKAYNGTSAVSITEGEMYVEKQ